MTKVSTPQRVFLIFFFTLMTMVFLPYTFSAESGSLPAAVFTALGIAGVLANVIFLMKDDEVTDQEDDQDSPPKFDAVEDYVGYDRNSYMSFDKSDYQD